VASVVETNLNITIASDRIRVMGSSKGVPLRSWRARRSVIDFLGMTDAAFTKNRARRAMAAMVDRLGIC